MGTGSLNAFLKDLVVGLVEELPEVSARRMFGSDAWFANGRIFSLVWDGRVAVKLTDPARYGALAAHAGAEPWGPIPRAKAMAHWLLVPEEFHDDADALRPWMEAAHRLALASPPKPVSGARAKQATASTRAKAAPAARQVSAKKSPRAKKATRR